MQLLYLVQYQGYDVGGKIPALVVYWMPTCYFIRNYQQMKTNKLIK